MENALFQKILKAENMHEKLKDLEARRKEIISELDNCEHEIVVVSKVISVGNSLRAKCLCCGKKYFEPYELSEVPYNNRLEVYRSKKIAYRSPDGDLWGYMSPDEVYDFVREKIRELTLAYPNITSEDLLKELREFFK